MILILIFASSLTSVGALTGISPEEAAYYSAGGFSNYFGIPSYQSSAVATYLSDLGTEYSGKYNASGRGYPDVSAQGSNFEIVNEGDTYTVDGTSCASPTFASVISVSLCPSPNISS
jgi:tripeptidyl-peptidase I